MENNNKYYTPDITDLYVGYTCTLINDLGIKYHNEVLDASTIMRTLDENEFTLETKYLDKEDIEKCGWLFDGNKSDDYKFYLGEFSLYFPYVDEEPVLITKKGNSIFYGYCKSINELRKIMGYLNIN